MTVSTTETNNQDKTLDVKNYIADTERKLIYSKDVSVSADKTYVVEIYAFENKPNYMLYVTLNIKGILGTGFQSGTIQIPSSSSASVYKVFEPEIIKPCVSFIADKSPNDNEDIVISCYIDGNKLLYTFKYNEDSDYPETEISLENSITDPRQRQWLEDLKKKHQGIEAL